MLYSSEKQFLFIHIYKTGGNSIRKALEPFADGYNTWYFLKGLLRENHVLPSAPAPKHANATVVKGALGEQKFEKAFKFAFVRNPWDWQVSLYHFGLRDKSNRHHGTISAFPDFEAYIKWRVTEERKLQAQMISNEEGKLMLDFVGRFESLQQDFDHICAKLGLPQKTLAKLNQSKRKPYREYYNDKSAELVARAYAEDISAFGYSF